MGILKRSISYKVYNEDNGILVKDALKLIENSPFYNEICEIFNLEIIKDHFVEVPGAKNLVNAILSMENKVTKFDMDTKLKNIRCSKFTESGQAILEISEIEDDDVLKILRKDIILAETRYSVRADYFNGLYAIDKYLSFLLRKGYKEIISKNLEMLEKKNEEENSEKRLRLIRDENGSILIRALTSTDRYKDYNIAFSVFVTLIKLHMLNRDEKYSFKVSTYNLTESEIKVVFKQNIEHKFIDKSKITFALELTNDEIKREAVRLKGVYSVSISDEKDILLQPKEGEGVISSFNHSINMDTVEKRLMNLDKNIETFIDDTLDDFKFTKKAKKPDDIRMYLVAKVIRSREIGFQKYKKEVLGVLSNRVSTIFQLLEILGKADDLISNEDIPARDFWQYKLYQALVEEVETRKE